jgi:hypothetical protein
MPSSSYKSVLCLRPQDDTTNFLAPIGYLFGENYIIIDDNEGSHNEALQKLTELQPTSLVIFLGHGTSFSLYSAKSATFEQRNFITKDHNSSFVGHNVILLACRSEQLILKLNGYNNIIGFGNIISSRHEITHDAELTGHFRKLEDEEIEIFNASYVHAVSSALELLLSDKIVFSQVSNYISFFINKCINQVLRNHNLQNRLELSTLLFEFRNDMKYLKG